MLLQLLLKKPIKIKTIQTYECGLPVFLNIFGRIIHKQVIYILVTLCNHVYVAIEKGLAKQEALLSSIEKFKNVLDKKAGLNIITENWTMSGKKSSYVRRKLLHNGHSCEGKKIHDRRVVGAIDPPPPPFLSALPFLYFTKILLFY